MKNSKIALLTVIAFAASVGISQAQTTLLVRFPFTDTDGGTSFACDPAGQANGFSMTTYNKSGVAGTFQGTPGGGVSGLGVALDFSTNSDFTTVGEGGATGAGPVGAVTNAALNFGFVSAFTATVWFKAVTNMPSTNINGNWDLGPRIFILGTAGATDKGVANTIGFFYQQWNCLAYSIGTSEIALPCFTSPTVVTTNSTNSAITYTNAYVPTNQWLFYTITYDGGNVVTIYSGTDQSAVTTVLATTSTTNVLTAAQVTAEGAFIGSDALATTPQNIGPGATGMNPTTLSFFANGANNSVLYIGNRQSRARTLDGWINDFRFYSGAATPNGVEDIRWSAVAPINFTAVPNNGDTQVTLNWNAVGGASGYNLLRGSATGGPYSTVLLNNQNQTSYVDSSISPTGNYFYVVQAVDANGDLTTGPNSVEVSYLGSPPPAVPTGLTATTPAPSEVVLNWASSGSPAANSFTVSRSTTSGQESFLATITGPTPPTTYTDASGVNGVKYFYKVSATSAAGTPSANSSEANATPFGPPEAPIASATSFGLSITVNWTDPNPPNIQTVDSFIILRSVNGGPFSQIATRGVGASSYNDTGLTVGNTYSYEVEAVNTGGTSPSSSATATIQISQQLTIQDIAEQTVRAAADHAGVVNDNGSGTIPGTGAANAVGFLRVKWVSDGNPAPGVDTTSCAKTYLRWSFAGKPPPDTNSDLTLTWTTDAAGVPTTMTLWSLDQPYQFVTGCPTPPGDGTTWVPPGSASTGITWDIAQANDTNYNPNTLAGTFQMLRTGPYTATPVAYFTGTGQVTVPTPVVVIPAPWGNLIHSNELVFCVGGTNNALTQASAGYRIANNSPALIYNQILGTTPPSISLIPNISLNINQTSSTINFTITDPDDGGASGVTAATVTVFNDTTGGTTASPPSSGGANQQFTVTAGPNPGTASVEVTITDGHGDLAQRTFTVTVLPPIAISTPAPTNTLANTAVVVPFTVTDTSYAQNTLTMTATVDAQSTAVLATAVATHVSGNNWTVTITPTGSTNGIGFVDLSVSDPGSYSASTAVPVMVQASPATVFSDTFNYTSPSSLLLENGSAFGVPPTVNDGIWNGIGPSGPVLSVSGNSLDFAVNANGEEGYANLLGGPYAPGHGYVIYTTFQANWSAFAGFTWLSLGEFSGVGGFQYAGVGSIPDLAADGGFNATIVNGPGGAGVTNPATLTPGTTYNIATRYDVDSAKATLWINATNEADPTATNVTATDLQAPAQISDITLNQNGAAGQATVVLNDLTVTLVVRPMINSISVVGGNVQIVFTAGVNDTPSTFSVTSTADLAVPLSAASPTIMSLGGGVFQATLPVSGNQRFYRVTRQPFAFNY